MMNQYKLEINNTLLTRSARKRVRTVIVLIIKITISSIVIGLKKILFSTNSAVELLSDSLLSDSLLSDSSKF